MNTIIMKKKSDENNWLGFDTIKIIDKEISEIRNEGNSFKFIYSFLAIIEGELYRIHENDWVSFDAYEIIET